jgi:Flp pilus assembly protein TadG
MRDWKDLLSRLCRVRRGNAGIEFALMAPIFAAALVGMVDLGMALYERMEVGNAAQAGAQYALNKGWDSTGIQSAVTSATGLAGVSATPAPSKSCGCANGTAVTAASCGSVCPSGSLAGIYITVNAQATYSTLFTYPGLDSPMTLTGQSVIRIQ